MATGYLQVQTTIADQAKAVANANVRIYKMKDNVVVYEDFFLCNNEGKTENIPLYAPNRSFSLDQFNDSCPYETYNVMVRCNGYEPQEVVDVQIFAGEYSQLPITLVPYGTYQGNGKRDVIPGHQLFAGNGENNHGQSPFENYTDQNDTTILYLNQVIIPTNITVHLGRPDRAAENVTVPFIYYLKNVASSEVYPTWPYEALKANIWAQISLVLNRVFTEWYPSRGFNFNITNSTAFDQAFVKNRNIYDNMAVIVDEVFNEYIQKRNFMEPYYAEYCDGKIAQCPGMKQWGTLDLANRGFTALNILKYYYGDTIRILSSNNIQDIRPSYPGTPFRLGSSGPQVQQLQEQLNAIAINYPNIKPIFPIDGVFGPTTEAAVRVFQRQFNLTVDGIIGKATYYQISFIFTAVRKLAELGSLGIIENLYNGVWPGTTLRQGDRGIEVQLLQYYLSVISVAYPQIPTLSIDGRFGPSMRRTVLAFQQNFGLAPDGLVGKATWDTIFGVYSSIDPEDIPNTPIYPGTPLRLGSRGDNVVAVQNALNLVATQNQSIPTVSADGIFGTGTQTAVRAFQLAYDLIADGIVGELTWNRIFQVASEIEQADETSSVMQKPNLSISSLQLKDEGDAVLKLQNELKTNAIYYKAIPDIAADGHFGKETQNAVIAFQNLLGLQANGIADTTTRRQIHQVFYELTQS